MNDCYVFLWLEEVYSIVLFVIPRLFVEIAICTACYFASWGCWCTFEHWQTFAKTQRSRADLRRCRGSPPQVITATLWLISKPAIALLVHLRRTPVTPSCHLIIV